MAYDPIPTLRAHLREAEHYRRQTTAAKTTHQIRMAAGSACNVPGNTIGAPAPGATLESMAGQGITFEVAELAAKLHQTAADAAACARVRFRERADHLLAPQFEALRDKHEAIARSWRALMVGDAWPEPAPTPAARPSVAIYDLTCPAYPCTLRATFQPGGAVLVEETESPQGLGEGDPKTETREIPRDAWAAFERSKLAEGYRRR